MATAAAVQEALFEIEDIQATAELERDMDRALCKKYFAGWIAAGQLSTTTIVDGITFEDFRAAGDRLAAAAT
ncbi:MAG: hypothetical protein DI630_27740 [Gordonia sp. (in: high G+C Gram-positive bacteria)]|nr:MAG: hypothetical protein DI630_27740 [Gordonia sp. (in: high G+C Gram-positive bacteria)]